MICRLGYAICVLIFGLPALPFFIIGVMFGDDNGTEGYFTLAGVGALFVALLICSPLILLGFLIRWIATGKGI